MSYSGGYIFRYQWYRHGPFHNSSTDFCEPVYLSAEKGNTVRIPCFIVVIATFVTIIEFLLKAYLPALNASLGLYIPLIVVNCLILARAEAFASKNGPVASAFDGIGMGLGFTIALGCLGLVREFIGSGTLFDVTVLPEAFPRTLLFVMAPGGFFTLAILMAILNHFRNKKA